MGVNAIYKEVPFLGQYRFKPMPFEAAAIRATGPYMVSEEATFINFAVYMLRQHERGLLKEAMAVVRRAKRAHYQGIFKAYKRALARREG